MCCKLHIEFNKREIFFDRRLERWFFTCLCYSTWLEIDDGFLQETLCCLFVGTQRPSPELLVGVWTVHCLACMACSVARFGRETSTNWLWGKRLGRDKQNLICEEKDFGRNKQKNWLWGKRLVNHFVVVVVVVIKVYISFEKDHLQMQQSNAMNVKWILAAIEHLQNC